MFSIFEYLRRRTCDSVLAGMYDAVEIAESNNFELPPIADARPVNAIASNERASNGIHENGGSDKGISESEALLRKGMQNGSAGQKSAPVQNAAPHEAQKKPAQPSPQGASPNPSVAPGPRPAPGANQDAPGQAKPTRDNSPSDLFGSRGQERNLPPRKRGRPKKYHHGGGPQ